MKNYINKLIIITIIFSNLYCANNLKIVIKKPNGSEIIMNCVDKSQALHVGFLFFFLAEYWTIGWYSALAEDDNYGRSEATFYTICK